MEIEVQNLNGKTFILNLLKYKVKSAKIVRNNAVILTDRTSFNLYPSEFKEWYERIEILSDLEVANSFIVPKVNVSTELKNIALVPEIIRANNMANEISSALMQVFKELAIEPKESTLKKARAMVDISNAVVNVQLANLRFLTIKKTL